MSSTGTVSVSYCKDWRDHVSEHCRHDKFISSYGKKNPQWYSFNIVIGHFFGVYPFFWICSVVVAFNRFYRSFYLFFPWDCTTILMIVLIFFYTLVSSGVLLSSLIMILFPLQQSDFFFFFDSYYYYFFFPLYNTFYDMGWALFCL